MEKRDQTHTNFSGTANNEAVNRPKRMAATVLRLASTALCVTTLVVMVKNSLSNDFGPISYSSPGAFKYLANTNGVGAGYTLLSALIGAMPCPFSMLRVWTFFFNQVITYVVLAAGVESAEVVYLAYKGNHGITWSLACDSYGGFCRKALLSIVITIPRRGSPRIALVDLFI